MNRDSMTTLKEVVLYSDELLQVQKFQDYCPNGLQVEGKTEIKKIVSGVTACQALINEAVRANADILLVHHGYFWKGESACISGIKQRRVKALLENDLSLLAYHLPLDAHELYGNNIQLAKILSIHNPKPILNDGKPTLVFEGMLPKEMLSSELQIFLNAMLGQMPLQVGPEKMIKRIAWCTGGAQSYFQQAIDAGADAFITGEISEPCFHIANEMGVPFFACGHHATERYGVQALGEHLSKHFALLHEFIDIPNPV